MKDELKFFVKTFLIGLVAIILMQLKVGESTVETHAISFVQSSAIVEPLRAVADGGAKALRDGYVFSKNKINGLLKR